MTRIFRYILQTDTGMAPCIDRGRLTLATCKPKIRSSAQPGDWVLGFYPRPFEPGLVAWAGRVARKLETGDYEREFRRRSDAVYRQKADGNFKRLQPHYHSGASEIRKDLSAPALVFDEQATWYFGDEPRLLPDALIHLAAGGQGHRVNGTREDDLPTLSAWLRSCSSPGIVGRPRHAPATQVLSCGCAGTKC
ncbi:hypothetical protein [Sphingobium sp. B12D2B]|uniref:Nmad2 family putative nucleotide modification protein n=1 Tax=Sphingobium sp. B12D2B TaxID=2940577 RepID=UPI0022246149|nr:hypothetical protein [Sphingobium sp. B12D2B]MCW2349173.1 hypothetical protein [Sphingobium sp. B12D2B]